tara:strand:- start:652 stop:1140 length:489 start_codon:yes stop_codon:yes gene_type:complete
MPVLLHPFFQWFVEKLPFITEVIMIIIAVIHGILELTKTEFEDGWLVAMSIILAVLCVCNLVVRFIKGRFDRIIWLILPLIIFMGSVLLDHYMMKMVLFGICLGIYFLGFAYQFMLTTRGESKQSKQSETLQSETQLQQPEPPTVVAGTGFGKRRTFGKKKI